MVVCQDHRGKRRCGENRRLAFSSFRSPATRTHGGGLHFFFQSLQDLYTWHFATTCCLSPYAHHGSLSGFLAVADGPVAASQICTFLLTSGSPRTSKKLHKVQLTKNVSCMSPSFPVSPHITCAWPHTPGDGQHAYAKSLLPQTLEDARSVNVLSWYSTIETYWRCQRSP